MVEAGSTSQLVVFISYSSYDGKEFAMKLRDLLERFTPPISPWIDLNRSRGQPFPPAIQEALGKSDMMLFVMTRDSVQSESWCLDEVARARRTGKRVLPLRLHDDAELPLELERRTPVDFSARDKRRAWKELEDALTFAASSQGRLESLQGQRRTLEHAEKRATGAAKERLQRGIAALDARIQEEQGRIEDPAGSRQRVAEAISAGQALERAEETGSVDRAGIRSVNDPPPLLPGQFRDRELETRRLEDRVRDPRTRLVAIVGRDGIGKTTMVAQLLDSLRADPERLPVDAFVYLSAHGPRPIRPAILLEDLRRVLVDQTAAAHLAERLNDPALTLHDKLDEVLEALAGTRVMLVIDDAEALLNVNGELRDRELDDLVRAMLPREHGVKILLVTHEAPEPLLREFRDAAVRLDLEAGLPRADAYDFLRTLDDQDLLGLRSAPEEYLGRAHQLTAGYPRALEALCSTLESEPKTSLAQLLIEMDQVPAGQDMVAYLVGRVFNRLDLIDRRVLQALAVYGRPVLPAAVDYLLQAYLDGLQSEPTLLRLEARRLIRRNGDRFYLPASPEGEWFLSGIPVGPQSTNGKDRPALTQLALYHRAAEYFVDARKPHAERLDDLGAQLSEIDLRMRGQEYGAAFKLINSIDELHLRGWGYSEVVAGWREQLVGKLGNTYDELHNHAWLADAKRRQEDFQTAIDHFKRAAELASRRRDKVNHCIIQITLATTYLESGQASRAARLYESALKTARRQRLPLQEAQAHSGLSLCQGETGQFRRAVDHHRRALEIVENRQDEESQTLLAQRLLSAGWLYGQMGRVEEALGSLQRGRAVASRQDEVLTGQLLDAEAFMRIDDGHLAHAIELATEAVAIGARTRNRHLSREANMTLALAHLCAGDLEAARGAADAAARYRRSRRALGAYLLQGITSFQAGQKEKAHAAFLDAHLQAETLRGQEHENFEVLDADGLALTGLVLYGERELLDRAVSSYRSARQVTREPGAVRRSLRLLDELTRDQESDGLATVRRAAAGQ